MQAFEEMTGAADCDRACRTIENRCLHSFGEISDGSGRQLLGHDRRKCGGGLRADCLPKHRGDLCQSIDDLLRGALLIAGGLYQISPLKEVCLAKCRTPLGFILGSWRSGYWGSFRMGLEHGAYCLGCCWLLFVILFPLGIMNVAAMAVLALLIYAEKALPAGRRIAELAAVILIAYGVLVIASPGMLPAASTLMPMPAEMSTPMPMK